MGLVPQDERVAMDTDGGAAVAPGALFAPGPAGAAERGSGLEVPPMVSRRVLDLATYLARHQGGVGRELVLLRVPTAAQQARALAAAQARSPTPPSLTWNRYFFAAQQARALAAAQARPPHATLAQAGMHISVRVEAALGLAMCLGRRKVPVSHELACCTGSRRVC